MALTPIPYTKNWFDVFGSQIADAALGAKIALPVISAQTFVDGILTFTATHALGVVIDWGDGSSTETGATGEYDHGFMRDGAYNIRVWPVGYPDAYVEIDIRMSITDDPVVEE